MRFAAVMMMTHFLDDEHIDAVLEETVSAHDDGYYFKMAAAWCLATCMAKYPEKTMASLEDGRLDGEIRRMAIRKALESYRIDEDMKARLRAMRRHRFLCASRCPEHGQDGQDLSRVGHAGAFYSDGVHYGGWVQSGVVDPGDGLPLLLLSDDLLRPVHVAARRGV